MPSTLVANVHEPSRQGGDGDPKITSIEKATNSASSQPTPSDLDTIWSWNHELAPYLDFCMHDVIAKRAQTHITKIAIDSWDGKLTYGQVDEYSTNLARTLTAAGVKHHDVVPLCFEKSKWTIVAVLAVMKSGATIALMDPSLPLARLQNMALQVGANMMLSSRKQYGISSSILPEKQIVIVDSEGLQNAASEDDTVALDPVPASALMYIIFTSGSTGTPKGVQISHGTYTSSAFPRAKAVGYNEESRVLDFASYAFDVSIDSMLLTLSNGGCLCIPSDEDRMNDINGVMRRMHINYAGITPSVARILDQDVIESLTALGLGGEAVSARDCTIWGQHTRIVIGYGPCECTIGCTVNSSAATGKDYVSIGPGNGAAMWIVDPDDHDTLMPLGAIGELLVEGPIVGQGYLNDPEKTAAAFIEDPVWLMAGHGTAYPGRRGRLYKTGDLGRYDPGGNGEIVFAGRKDTQVKLRGQRVELGEIESHIRDQLSAEDTVIAEVITPTGSGNQATLVAFIAARSTQSEAEIALSTVSTALQQRIQQANEHLMKVVPRYMVPTAYIPTNFIPLLVSGKTDRKRLRQFGATVDLRQLDQPRSTAEHGSLSDLELSLRASWSHVLSVAEDNINAEDNFFVLGGDSLAAMKLAADCKLRSLSLTVADIFANPRLKAMAKVIRVCETHTTEDIPAFAFISRPLEDARREAAEQCNVAVDQIEDIYPATPTQESLFTFALKSKKAYVAQRIARIPRHIDLEAWKGAWETVVAAHPILRTRIAQLQEFGLQQVVIKESILWRHETDLESYLENNRAESMDLGQCLARYAICNDSENDNAKVMVLTMHHVLYDGWSEPLILQKVAKVLQHEVPKPAAPMSRFVHHIQQISEVELTDFWRCELDGATGPQFPRLPSRDYLPNAESVAECHIELDTSRRCQFTTATLIRGAWALVSSQHAESNDVVFGETLTGRDIALEGVESIVGPLIATIPVRVSIERKSTVHAYLEDIQRRMSMRAKYQHMGMQYIRKISQDAQHACEAPAGLVIQPEMEYSGCDLGFSRGDVVAEALKFNPYPLMLAIGLRPDGLRVCASFDRGLIDMHRMERVLAQFEAVFRQLALADSTTALSRVHCLCQNEIEQIWSRNAIPPLVFDSALGRLRADARVKPGSAYPPAVVPWVVDIENDSMLAAIGCVGELCLEGAFLPGEPVDSPQWLTSGSKKCRGRNGRVRPTGDIVRLLEDGSIEFVRRKYDVFASEDAQGTAVELTNHIASQLQSATRFTVVACKIVDGGVSIPKLQLVVFLEESSSQNEELVQIMSSDHDLSLDVADSSEERISIRCSISIGMAYELKRLGKYGRDSLPSYLKPAAYAVVDRCPRADLNGLEIPSTVFAQMQGSLGRLSETLAAQNMLSPAEGILQDAWSKLLQIPAKQIQVDDNFFRLGGDSVLAMKLVSNMRSQGHGLTVADVFQNMRLSDAAKVLKLHQVQRKQSPAYMPFSMLQSEHLDTFLADVVRPKLQSPQWQIEDCFPVTDMQALDIRATTHTPRTSVQYTVLHFEKSVDRLRLLKAWSDLVSKHGILRTVFVEYEGAYLQVVLDSTYQAPVELLDCEVVQSTISELAARDISSQLDLGTPFAKAFLVGPAKGSFSLMIRLSHAQYDGISLPNLLADLDSLYAGRVLKQCASFPSYVAYARDSSVRSKALAYWRSLLNGSSVTRLEGELSQLNDTAIFQSRLLDSMDKLEEFTTANLLTAAWALVLARRLQVQDVTFGAVSSGRGADFVDAEHIHGPCYTVMPVRVSFEPEWTAGDLLQFVQSQTAASAAYDFMGFETIAKECTSWSTGDTSVGSLVHHQEVDDDMDTMPFANELCRIEVVKPHGDAATPFKAVTFVKSGKTHVGVVGSERDAGLVDEILGTVARTMEELADRGSRQTLCLTG